LQNTNFIVGVHDADQDRLVGNGALEHLHIDSTVAHDREVGNAAALLFQVLAGIENRFVFRSRGDDVVAFFGIHLGDALDREVV
jgi:hypothetical protein